MSDPKSECEELLNVLMPFAHQTLERYGEFYSCGATLDASGKIALAAIGEDVAEDLQEMVRIINDGFIAGARSGEYRATALAYEATVVPPGGRKKVDAIAVALDHRDSYSVLVFFPYTVNGQEVVIGAPFGGAGEGQIFAA
jgi:hypothetical protein